MRQLYVRFSSVLLEELRYSGSYNLYKRVDYSVRCYAAVVVSCVTSALR